MFRGLYTATSAMQTTEKKIDLISNNLANVNTTGFKKDVLVTETFPQVLLQKLNGVLPPELSPASPVQVEEDRGAYQLTTVNGFFSAQTPTGISYSRSTSFAVDENGYLKTFSRDLEGNLETTYGNLILDNTGNPIQIEEGQELAINEAGQAVVDGQVVAALIRTVNPYILGTVNGGSRVNSVEANFSQGSLEETGNPFHLALYGNGFFQVQNMEGTRFYTRNGSFSFSDYGELMTSEGYFLLSESGDLITAGGTNFLVTETGAVMVDDQVVDQISLVDITNTRELRKHGEGYYYPAAGSEIQTRQFQGAVQQGYLEGANVNPITEMVSMIAAHRNYESSQKVVRVYDEMLQRAVNDIAKF